MMQGIPDSTPLVWLGAVGAVILLFLFFLVFIVKQYKRCPSNKVLVIYGKVGTNQAARCLHGGGKFVLPLIQDYAYLALEPMVIEIPLEAPLVSRPTR
jgi:flotillin